MYTGEVTGNQFHFLYCQSWKWQVLDELHLFYFDGLCLVRFLVAHLWLLLFICLKPLLFFTLIIVLWNGVTCRVSWKLVVLVSAEHVFSCLSPVTYFFFHIIILGIFPVIGDNKNVNLEKLTLKGNFGLWIHTFCGLFCILCLGLWVPLMRCGK